jgi:hypothetical protein
MLDLNSKAVRHPFTIDDQEMPTILFLDSEIRRLMFLQAARLLAHDPSFDLVTSTNTPILMASHRFGKMASHSRIRLFTVGFCPGYWTSCVATFANHPNDYHILPATQEFSGSRLCLVAELVT